MGIVGVNSTVGRAVKCIDPGKTTKSESSWLGYTLCDLILSRLYQCFTVIYSIEQSDVSHTHKVAFSSPN